MRECIDEGILQAYADNELSSEMAARVAEHINSCAACAGAASAAAEETALFARAFEAESALDVPTVRLRERLDDAIAELDRPAVRYEPEQSRGLGGWLASLGGLFKVSPRRALGYASLVAVLAFAAIFTAVKLNGPETKENPATVASNDKGQTNPPAVNSSPTPAPAVAPTITNNDPNKDGSGGNGGGRKENAPPRRERPKKPAAPVLVPQPDQLPQQELAIINTPLPGEQNYLKAINSLQVEIEAGGEAALKPSLRAEYERNLAIVDQAIFSTRRTARSNPNDPDAAEFLYSTYQSKLDLLNAVAQQVRPTLATR
ncbi:MAG TPA: zf-HC2 domain-containing protein [Pyrinomonadaceae bacterium]|nr:zf-HC2 domain-containing protein [Pyrinomonadaceae bacterium]